MVTYARTWNGTPLRDNGAAVRTPDDLANLLEALQIGNHVTVDVIRDGMARQITVAMEPYDVPDVKIKELPDLAETQKAAFAAWNAGH